jgi:cytochrome o ubiquinol oxidase operon protein cyoD
VSAHSRFPWLHVSGYALSVLLTAVALLLVLNRALPRAPLETVVLALAVLQIGVQLFFFMHVTEGQRPRVHMYTLTMALFFTIVIVAGSIWIMTFGGTGAY